MSKNNDNVRRVTELLSPAGDWECLRAAVANGADAVYFGLPMFSARQKATNFTLEELPEVMEYLHQRNVKGYVALNTLIFSDELGQAAGFVGAAAESGCDAVIVQDLGLIELIGRMAPTLAIHASTQATQTEAGGIAQLAKMGVRRVILARELSVEQVRRIAAATDMELEVFVHGALCISFSGQCLASESMWGRSANRGLCGQGCRLPYQIVADGAVVDGGKEYPLSPHDLAAHQWVGELVKLGAAGLKIEGRLKSSHYVAATTGVYRQAIDAAVRAEPFTPSAKQLQELEQSFSRGFTGGFLGGADHRSLVGGESPKSRGVHLGSVVTVSEQGVIVSLEQMRGPAAGGPGRGGEIGDYIKAGDGVVFESPAGGGAEQGGRIYYVHPFRPQGPPAGGGRGAAPFQVELVFGPGAVDLSAIAEGSVVWKTDDPRLRRELEGTYSRDVPPRRAPLRITVRGKVGHELLVIATDGAGREARASWPGPLEEARQYPLSTELVRAQFQRLGNTPFELAEVELVGPGGKCDSLAVMAPKSVLNELRRQVVAELIQKRGEAARHRVAHADALEELQEAAMKLLSPEGEGGSQGRVGGKLDGAVEAQSPVLHVLVRTMEQLEAALEVRAARSGAGMGMIYLDLAGDTLAAAIAKVRAAGAAVAVATPRILMPGEEASLEAIAAASPDAVLVRNLGAAAFFAGREPAMAMIADHSFNVVNELSCAAVVKMGTRRVTAGYDLNLQQFGLMLRAAPAGVVEAVVHQHVPMFHTAHCLFCANLGAGASEDSTSRQTTLGGGTGTAQMACGRPCLKHDLKLQDRLGVQHPVRTDAFCRNTVFHCRAQSVATDLPGIIEQGGRHFRLELLEETATVSRTLVEIYLDVVTGAADGKAAWRRLWELLEGNVTDGTWETRR